MNKHPLATVDLALCALGNLVGPLLVFSIGWCLTKLLLADGDPQWGTPLFWASGFTTFFIYQFTIDPPLTISRPPDATHIPPLTKAHLAIKMGLTALYTVVFSLILGMAGKPVLGPWLSAVLPAVIIVPALFQYRRLYRSYCKELLEPESAAG